MGRIKEGLNNIGFQVLATVTEATSRVIFPYKVIEGSDSLNQLSESLRQGKGAIILINHFSKRDGIQAIQLFLKYFASHSSKSVMPIARHELKPSMSAILEKMKLEVFPIADNRWEKIKEAVKSLPKLERKELFKQLREEQENYLKNAEHALNNGGVVGLAAQSMRKPSLEKPITFPVQEILEKTKIKTSNVVIMTVGLGFAKETDYQNPKVRGYNKGKKFIVKAGDVFNLSDVLKMIENEPNIESIDQWIYQQLTRLVPSEYLGKSE